MPFDSSGNFTRDYNWVDDRNAGIKIEATRMDGEFDNYAAALNQTMLRTGLIAMTGDLNMQGNGIYNLEPGSLATPSLRFINDTTTGIASLSTGTVSLITTGAEVLRATVDGAAVDGDFGVTGDIIGDGNVIVNGGAAVAELIVNGAEATTREIAFESTNLRRWNIAANAVAEGGSNAGSDFNIGRYSDAGVLLDNPLVINRATGLVTLTGPGGLKVQQLGGGGTIASLVMDCQPTTNGRNIIYTTNGLARWSVQSPCGNETGSNVGSDFAIRRFTDGGVSIDFPLTINRASGLVTLGSPGGLIVTGPSQHNGPIYFNYNMASVLPPVGGGAIGWNYSSGNGEVDFFNTFPTAGISFQFYQMASASARTLLLNIAPSGSTIYTNFNVNGAMGVTGNFSAGSTGITGTLTVTGNFTAANATITGLVQTSNLGVNGGNIAIDGAVNTGNRYVAYTSAAKLRFYHGLTATAESGSNAGADFFIARATDAGGFIDTPLTIYRSTGSIAMSNNLSVVGSVIAGFIQSSGGMSITGAAGTNRQLVLSTNNLARWAITAEPTAESGGNAGSHLYFNRFNDAGGFLDTPLYINRTNGQVVTNNFTATNATVGGALTVAGTSTFNGGSIFNWATIFAYNIGTAFPATGGNGAITWNHSAGQGEIDFWNNYTGGTAGFSFYQMTATNTATLLAQLTTGTATFYTNVSCLGNIYTPGSLTINGAPATARQVFYQTNGSTRWRTYAETTAESGSNNGSHYNLSRHNDSGVYIDTPLQIQRPTGQCIFLQPIVNGSDMRLKKNIKPLKDALDVVERLQGVFYNSKSKGVTGRKVGLVAQDVLEVLPEVVHEGDDENKTLGIEYTSLVPMLIEAIKELSQKVRTLEAAAATRL